MYVCLSYGFFAYVCTVPPDEGKMDAAMQSNPASDDESYAYFGHKVGDGLFVSMEDWTDWGITLKQDGTGFLFRGRRTKVLFPYEASMRKSIQSYLVVQNIKALLCCWTLVMEVSWVGRVRTLT